MITDRSEMGTLDNKASGVNIGDLELVVTVVDVNMKKWLKNKGSKDRGLALQPQRFGRRP